MSDTLKLSLVSDLHVHLRQGPMMKFVVPHIKEGGIGRVLVMPNTLPPITTVEQALEYHKQLSNVDPTTIYLMTLYLTKDMTADEIQKAANTKGIITGVKFYPKGMTTHSEFGISNLIQDIPKEIFQALSDCGIVLHLHGESLESCCGSHHPTSFQLDAERSFIPTLRSLSTSFPNLKIVMEHVTTKEAVECVMNCGNNVAATITPHHLALTVDDVFANPLHYCKPIIKFPSDRDALWNVVTSGHSRFFLGSDSAPHTVEKKLQVPAAAGIYSLPYLLPLLAHLFEQHDCLDRLNDFVCNFGPRFINLPNVNTREITLKKHSLSIPNVLTTNDIQVIPFYSGKTISWSLQ